MEVTNRLVRNTVRIEDAGTGEGGVAPSMGYTLSHKMARPLRPPPPSPHQEPRSKILDKDRKLNFHSSPLPPPLSTL